MIIDMIGHQLVDSELVYTKQDLLQWKSSSSPKHFHASVADNCVLSLIEVKKRPL